MSEELWDNIRMWYPPMSKDGRYYRTKFKRRIIEGNKATVEMELIPE